jgi:tetratricopeptide (TPR) repeat protein
VTQLEPDNACHSGTARRAGPGIQEHWLFQGIRFLCSWIPGSRIASAPRNDKATLQTEALLSIGVDFSGARTGGNIIVSDVRVGYTDDELLAALEARGMLREAELTGLQRRTVVMLAQRLKPAERLDFEQALTELEYAVEMALDVIRRGERGSNDDAFVNAVLARVAEHIRRDDLDGAAAEVGRARAQLSAEYKQLMVVLLEEIKVHTLRRDAVAVARRVEELAGIENPAERPAWRSEFRARRDAFASEGETKGINFSLSVAIEMARLMLAAARSADERGTALNLLGNALWGLGERESGTARLEETVEAHRAALTERTRERVPLDWAGTQNNLGNALASLGERESGTARLEEAVAAYRAAQTERTRERVPLLWAGTQQNLAIVFRVLATRSIGDARVAYLRDALAAVDGALEVYRAGNTAFYVERAERLRADILAETQQTQATPR